MEVAVHVCMDGDYPGATRPASLGPALSCVVVGQLPTGCRMADEQWNNVRPTVWVPIMAHVMPVLPLRLRADCVLTLALAGPVIPRMLCGLDV